MSQNNNSGISCWKRFGNGFLFTFVLACAFGLIALILSRGHFEEISQMMYPDAPLMNSGVLSALLGKTLLVFVILVLLAILAKRFYLHSFQQRVRANLLGLFLLLPFVWFIIWKLYLPAA